MAQVSLVMPTDRPPLTDELAATLRHELARQDMPAEPSPGAFGEDGLGRVYVLLEPERWLREAGRAPAEAVLRRTVVLVDEPPAAGDDALQEMLEGAGAVFAPDQRRATVLHRLSDRPVRVLRAGYSEPLDRFDPDAERPVDVTVLGVPSSTEREAIAAALTGTVCKFAEEGASRLEPLSRSKLVLNLHDGPCAQLEWRRVLDAVHCGAVVVTEHAGGIAPLAVGEHLLAGSRDALPYIAAALLRDPQRLATMRAAAYQRLREWMPYALPVSVLRAAIVELVGEPVAV